MSSISCTTPIPVPQVCAECGQGYYRTETAHARVMTCTSPNCDHAVGARDFDLGPGESLTVANGVLCWVPAEDDTDEMED